MEKKKILDETSQLIQDIDKCIGDLVSARCSRKKKEQESATLRMEALMVLAHQELSFLYDYIKDEENGNTGNRL